MRRLAIRIDQMPVWAFVAGAVLVFATARAGRLFALLHQNRGGMELGALATLATFLGVVIFAIRRRHINAWRSTVHVLGSLVAGNAVAILMIWPFIPDGYAVSLAKILSDTLVAGTMLAVGALPVAIAMLWLSRRYGSHSQVTERRLRVIQDVLRRRAARGAGSTPAGTAQAEADADA